MSLSVSTHHRFCQWPVSRRFSRKPCEDPSPPRDHNTSAGRETTNRVHRHRASTASKPPPLFPLLSYHGSTDHGIEPGRGGRRRPHPPHFSHRKPLPPPPPGCRRHRCLAARAGGSRALPLKIHPGLCSAYCLARGGGGGPPDPGLNASCFPHYFQQLAARH